MADAQKLRENPAVVTRLVGEEVKFIIQFHRSLSDRIPRYRYSQLLVSAATLCCAADVSFVSCGPASSQDALESFVPLCETCGSKSVLHQSAFEGSTASVLKAYWLMGEDKKTNFEVEALSHFARRVIDEAHPNVLTVELQRAELLAELQSDCEDTLRENGWTPLGHDVWRWAD